MQLAVSSEFRCQNVPPGGLNTAGTYSNTGNQLIIAPVDFTKSFFDHIEAIKRNCMVGESKHCENCGECELSD